MATIEQQQERLRLDFGKRKPFKSNKGQALVLPAFWVHQFLHDVLMELEVTGDEKELRIKIPQVMEAPSQPAPNENEIKEG